MQAPENVPVPLVDKVTVPVGGVGVADVSVTVAVHVDPWLTTTGLEQARPMAVEWIGGVPYVPSWFVVTMVTPLPTMLVFIR